MTRAFAVFAFLLLLCAAGAAAATATAAPASAPSVAATVAASGPALSRAPKAPEDLGPAEIDVSDYPEEYRNTYQKIFLPAFKRWGSAAHVLNSPIIEMDEATERTERAAHPQLFADSRIALPSRDGWKKYMQGLLNKPACCGACPTLTLEQARAVRSFLVYDSLRRKTGANTDAWIRHRRELVDRFETMQPQEKRNP